MLKKRTIALLLCFCVFCCLSILIAAQPVYAQDGYQKNPVDYREIDDYLRSAVGNAHIPGMSVTIVNKDAVLFSGNYGDCESSETPFYLGSVSKSFTAVCIMQLVEQGKVDLNAPVSAYLPGATDGDRISVSQLLNHTSGLGQYQTLENYKIVNEQGVHHYANVNYSLLGEIIEAVSGESYSDYITKNLFEPLQLSHTAATQDESEKNGLIDGYTNYWGFNIKTSHKYPSSKDDWITVPAGYISSSTEDLGKYLQMYLNRGSGILSESSIDTMFYGDTIYVDGDIPYWYGYGWTRIEAPLSEPVLQHNGLVETGNACIFLLPESSLAMAVTANVNDYFAANAMIDSLGWGVALMLLGDAPNEISGSTYTLNHLWLNLTMLAVLTIAIIPLCRLSKYRERVLLLRGNKLPGVYSLIGLHFLLPVFLLMAVPVFLKIPLWVVQAFVPDVFLTIIVSAVLLLAVGFLKGGILWAHKKTSLRRRPWILRLCAGLFILIFTVGFMLIGGGILYSAHQEEAGYTGTTTGTVVGYESRMGDADDSFRYFYAPIVRYKTTKGSLCTGIGNVWTSNRPFEVGEQIDIRYNPIQTDVVNVEGYGVSVSYKLGIAFFLFGSAVSVLLLIFLILTKLIRDPDKREQIMGKLVATIIALFIAGVWCMLAGIKITLAVFGLLGLYALFQHYKKRREP